MDKNIGEILEILDAEIKRREAFDNDMFKLGIHITCGTSITLDKEVFQDFILDKNVYVAEADAHMAADARMAVVVFQGRRLLLRKRRLLRWN